jgi:branched-chain amino acid transport system ATP-binding protein
MLSVKNLVLRFGGLTAVNDVSFSVNKGEIFSIIGPNGAGKTSLFNAISGVYEPTSGKVFFNELETQKKWNVSTFLVSLLWGLASGLLLLLVANINSLWQTSVIDVFNENPLGVRTLFPFYEACSKALTFIVALSWYESFLPFVVGSILGGAGSISLWCNSRRTSDSVAKFGLTRTFQNIRLFKGLTVFENILVGMDQKLSTTFIGALLRLPASYAEVATANCAVHNLLNLVGLDDVADRKAVDLSYGHQRRVEIARALASSPQLLLLDEPAAGMNPTETEQLMELIKRIRKMGVTIVLIEHHMKVVMGISDRILVLNYGNNIAEGTPVEIQSNPQVIEAYLGRHRDE